MFTRGPMALAMEDMTTWRPAEREWWNDITLCRAGLVLLGTPDTSFRGLRTLKVLSMDRSGPAAFPSSDFGINIGRNLKHQVIFKNYSITIFYYRFLDLFRLVIN